VSILGKVLYIGGFELPDKNAAAQRVIGIAKCIRDIGYQVVFVNALKKCDYAPSSKEYFGFSTLEYRRESVFDYLIQGRTAIKIIRDEKPNIVIAYNYPSVALNNIRRYCQNNSIKCIADVTEWSRACGGNVFYRLIKNMDTCFRMRYVHKHMDAVIAISRYLYNYYRDYTPVCLVPPLIDIKEEKWRIYQPKDTMITSFVYAGSPSAIKERLDLIVAAVDACAKKERIVLNIVGITKPQFIRMFNWKKPLSDAILFWGRQSHEETIRIVKKSNWSILIRDNNSVVKAGFPTKLVESISCGTPVLANKFSNIDDFLNANNSLVLEKIDLIERQIKIACNKHLEVDKSIFHYEKYIDEVRKIFM